MPRDFDKIGEEYLTLLAQGRDPQAFTQLYRRIHPRLRAYANTVLQDSDEAADAAQDAWIAIHRGLPYLRDPAAFRAWAFRVVHRRCVDLIRKKQRRRKAEADSDPPTNHQVPPGTVSGDERLRTLIAELPPDRRGLLELVYKYDLTLHEIAVVFEIPVGTVKSRLHHIRTNLKQRLTQKDHE